VEVGGVEGRARLLGVDRASDDEPAGPGRIGEDASRLPIDDQLDPLAG